MLFSDLIESNSYSTLWTRDRIFLFLNSVLYLLITSPFSCVLLYLALLLHHYPYMYPLQEKANFDSMEGDYMNYDFYLRSTSLTCKLNIEAHDLVICSHLGPTC
jgi:hypothetical protein